MQNENVTCYDSFACGAIPLSAQTSPVRPFAVQQTPRRGRRRICPMQYRAINLHECARQRPVIHHGVFSFRAPASAAPGGILFIVAGSEVATHGTWPGRRSGGLPDLSIQWRSDEQIFTTYGRFDSCCKLWSHILYLLFTEGVILKSGSSMQRLCKGRINKTVLKKRYFLVLLKLVLKQSKAEHNWPTRRFE